MRTISIIGIDDDDEGVVNFNFYPTNFTKSRFAYFNQILWPVCVINGAAYEKIIFAWEKLIISAENLLVVIDLHNIMGSTIDELLREKTDYAHLLYNNYVRFAVGYINIFRLLCAHSFVKLFDFS